MAQPTVEYLTDPGFDRVLMAMQGWGVLGMDTCVHQPGQAGIRLQIGDTEYDRGLGHHAPGQILLDLGGDYETFEAEVGVQKQEWGTGTVEFRVYVDDALRFDSGIMHESDAARPVSVDVRGALELRLELTDAGDGITCDAGNWANARLVRAPGVSNAPRLETFDAGPFATVVTCDPARMDGARADRVHEFLPGDVFLETPAAQADNGDAEVRVYAGGVGCVGLRWAERRLVTRAELVFAPGQPLPDPGAARVEFWTGESIWQGAWKAAAAPVEVRDGVWTARLEPRANPDLRNGTWKLRWVISGAEEGLRARELRAFTRARTQELVLRLEPEDGPAGVGRVAGYNGWLLPDPAGAAKLAADWDTAGPLDITVRHTRPRLWKSDATLLRFALPGRPAFSVAVEDLLSDPCVYVKPAGVFITRAATGLTLAEWKRQCEGRQTVLERVRQMPDQTFAQAWEHVHNPIQRNGPTMLSLACDNRKFIVGRAGEIDFSTVPNVPDVLLYYPQEYPCQMRPVFGSGSNEGLTRFLDGDWLPVPVTRVTDGGVEYSERSFVAPLGDADGAGMHQHAVCVAEITATNPGPGPAAARVAFELKAPEVALQQLGGRVVATSGGQVLAVVDAGEAAGLALTVSEGVVTLGGELAAGASGRCVLYLPAWFVAPEDQGQLGGWEALLEATRGYWRAQLAGTTQIELPDKLLTDTIRASQVHCLIAARSEGGGERVAPWIASNVYGPLESEANTIVSGMDLLGHEAFTRRCLDYYIHRYAPEGSLTTGYTLMGLGWHLGSLGEYWDLHRNAGWLRGAAPDVGRACRWITRQREMTRRVGPGMEKLPGYGLVPPGVTADWGVFSYRHFNQGHYCNGLRETARALEAVGYPGADELVAGAEDFRREIVRAYGDTQALAAALPLQDGSWVPGSPSTVESFGLLKDVFPGEDGNRSWAYDGEIGAHQLIALGMLDPAGEQAGWIMDQIEDGLLLDTGMGDYRAELNHKDWFNLGGFAKVQPYYARICEDYALRDEVKPYIRAYLNAIPSLLNPENLTFWEHFHNQGAWCKTHETGEFLRQTRFMLVLERGQELWLAPFAGSVWMGDGERIVVRDAPTRFGPVSYEITSHVGEGYIEATIEGATRNAPEAVVIRLRHPEGKLMQRVTVNGQAHTDFDAAKETVRLAPGAGRMVVRAEY